MELGVEGDELLGGQRGGRPSPSHRRADIGEVVLGLSREGADHPLLQQEAGGDDVGEREPCAATCSRRSADKSAAWAWR